MMRHSAMFLAALLAISARGAESPPQFSAAGVSAPIVSFVKYRAGN
jgi:hypothetical protein